MVEKRLLSVVIASVIAMTGHVEAESVFIENAGFEDDVLADGTYFFGAPSGWTLTEGVGGPFNPTTLHFPEGAAEGENTVFSNDGIFSQVLDDVLTVNNSYVLSIDIGSRLDIPAADYFVELWAGNTLLGSTSSELPEAGRFTTVTVTYDALLGDPSVGSALMIRFAGLEWQTNFDNVRLNATLIPAPASLAMIVFAAAGVRRRRRR